MRGQRRSVRRLQQERSLRSERRFLLLWEKMKRFLIKVKTRANAILSPNKILCSYEIEANSESEARARALEMFAHEKYGAFLSEQDLKIKIEKI